MNWGEFLAMGGYAVYVWSAWGITLIVLGYLFTQAKWRGAKIRRELARQVRREQISTQTTEETMNQS